MKINITKNTLLVAFLFFAIGCNSNSVVSTQNNDGNTTRLPTAVESALNSEKSILSGELTNTLSYMGNEERLAYDVYNRLYSEWGTKQFKF